MFVATQNWFELSLQGRYPWVSRRKNCNNSSDICFRFEGILKGRKCNLHNMSSGQMQVKAERLENEASNQFLFLSVICSKL